MRKIIGRYGLTGKQQVSRTGCGKNPGQLEDMACWARVPCPGSPAVGVFPESYHLNSTPKSPLPWRPSRLLSNGTLTGRERGTVVPASKGT